MNRFVGSCPTCERQTAEQGEEGEGDRTEIDLVRPTAATCYGFPGRPGEAAEKFPRSRAPALIETAIPAIGAHEYLQAVTMRRDLVGRQTTRAPPRPSFPLPSCGALLHPLRVGVHLAASSCVHRLCGLFTNRRRGSLYRQLCPVSTFDPR